MVVAAASIVWKRGHIPYLYTQLTPYFNNLYLITLETKVFSLLSKLS